MDRIVFWGGGEALASWQKGIGPSTILIPHGPKMSFGVISKAGLASSQLPELAARIGFDIAAWEQRACNCPQIPLIEESVSDDELTSFGRALGESLEALNERFPPAKRTSDECVEILKARELAVAKGLVTGAPIDVAGPATLDWTVICEKRPSLDEIEPSPLNRTILIKRYPSLASLSEALANHSAFLQTVGYCLGAEEISGYAVSLAAAGVTRLCPFGIMPIPAAGAPHDGRYGLRDLVRFTVIE